MKITVVGIGYVGLSNAILLAQHNPVLALDIDAKKVNMINNRISPIKDAGIEEYLSTKSLNLKATTDKEEAYDSSDFIIIATPTDYDPNTSHFNTSSIESVIEDILIFSPNTPIVIKSTIPVGYTQRIKEQFNCNNIIFSPEFLREGRALYDNLYPTRIVVGEDSDRARAFAKLLQDGAIKEDIPVLFTGSTEAEAVKLFANTYLAMRVAFFNELDTYAMMYHLDSKQIIQGIGLDARIGDHYNNPSFGYGGYCLPKDTRQLLANYKDIPNNIIKAIVEANKTRKDFITEQIIHTKVKRVGIYRIVMKAGSDNFRTSAILGIINRLLNKGVEVIIYEPMIEDESFMGCKVINNLDEFQTKSDIIVANRITDEIKSVKDKLFTRDIFNCD